jgi:hypothetical protein
VGRGDRSRSPQWKWMAFLRLSKLRKPRAVYFIHWIVESMLSLAASVMPCFREVRILGK